MRGERTRINILIFLMLCVISLLQIGFSNKVFADTTMTVSPSTMDVKVGRKGRATLEYNGDGLISVSSADSSVATAYYDSASGEIVISGEGTGTTTITVSASSTANSPAISRTIDVSVDVEIPAIMTVPGSYMNSYIYNSSYKKDKIEEIILKEDISTPENLVYTIGNVKDASSSRDVYAWIIQGENSGMYKLVIGGDGSLYTPQNASYGFLGYSYCTKITNLSCLNTQLTNRMDYMFSSLVRLKEISLGESFDTSNVTDMTQMFYNCMRLETLNLGNNFNTSKVLNMSSMFGVCNALVSLDLGEKFDTSLVTDMSSMFNSCYELTTLNIGNKFDTSNVINMKYMFSNCKKLTTLELGELFDTSKVTNMSYMFSTCEKLTTLNLKNNFDTSSVTNMTRMFQSCSGLGSLNLGNKFDTSKVESMDYMFWNCYGLNNLNLGDNFDTSSVKNMEYMFSSCFGFTTLDLKEKFDTSNATNMSNMFSYCSNLTNIDLKDEFDTSKVLNMQSMFDGCQKLESIDFGEKFNTSSVTNMTRMFSNCLKLGSIDLKDKFDTSSVTDMSRMFYTCRLLTTLDLKEKFDTSNVTNMSYMFYSCSNLTSLDLGEKFDTSSVTNMSNMFNGCSKLEALDLEDKFDTSNVTNMEYMFSSCSKLTSLDLEDKFDTSNVTNMHGMFSSCSKLSSLDLGDKFDTSSVTNMQGMFQNNGLSSIDFGDKFDTSNVTNMQSMFQNCDIKHLYLGDKFDTSKVTQLLNMFYDCNLLETIMLGSNFRTIKGSSMFRNTNKLEAVISLSDAMMTNNNNNNGFPNNAKATLYVKTKSLEDDYEDDSFYQNQFMSAGEDRISRIIKPSGDEVVNLKFGEAYVEKGASVIDDRIPFATLAAQYNLAVTISGDTVDTSAPTASGDPFEVIYILTKSGEEIARATREVNVKGPAIMKKGDMTTSIFGDSTYLKKTIEEIILKENIETPDDAIYSYGSIKDASSTEEVYAWLIAGDTAGKYKLVIGGDGSLYTPVDASYQFYGYSACNIITNLDCLNTRLTTNMSNLFHGCSKITSLNLGENFDTSEVTNMSSLFDGCRGLTNLDLGEKFNTSKVANMACMFQYCTSLPSIDFGEKFDTSNVTNMESIFSCCEGLSSLNLSDKFKTSKVTNMLYMFYQCKGLTSLNLGEDFDTSEVINMGNMFYNCKNLPSLDLGNLFDTSNVTNMNNMFDSCRSLTELDLKDKFDTSNVTSMSGMFKSCDLIKNLDLGDLFNTSKVTNMDTMFSNCPVLETLELGDKFNTSSVTRMSGMFNNCNSLTSIDFKDKFDTSNVTNMSSMFYNCYNLISLDFKDKFDTSKVNNYSYMFYRCTKLKSLDLGDKFSTPISTNMQGMFYNCQRLESILLGKDFSKLYATALFTYSNDLKAIISLSDTMMTSGDNTLPNTAKAGLYVKTKALEEAYEADTKYQSQFMTDNEDRISRIIKPSGDEIVNLRMGDTYVEKGATIIDDRIPFATLAAQYNLAVTISGDTVDTSVATPSGEPFEVVYILTKSGEEIARATREVNVKGPAIMQAGSNATSIFGDRTYLKNTIEEIILKENIETPDDAIYSYGSIKDASSTSEVYAWLISGDTAGKYKLVIGGDGSLYTPVNASYQFYGYSACTQITNSACLNTSLTTNMSSMFFNCGKLTSLNIGENFDTSKVKDMQYMFYGCRALTSLDLGDNFDTSNVTYMNDMFSGCNGLTTLDLGEKYDTSRVLYMSEMFRSCNGLTNLDLGENFDTSSVTNMNQMFQSCSGLESLNLGNKFDTSKVTNMSNMFDWCTNLINIDLGDKFDTSSVERMSYMFNDCKVLTSLDLGEKFDTSSVVAMDYMFYGCQELTSLDLGEKFDTSSVTYMSDMFYKCSSLTSLDLGDKFDTSKVINMSDMFCWCTNLTNIYLGEKFDKLNGNAMFLNDASLKAIISLSNTMMTSGDNGLPNTAKAGLYVKTKALEEAYEADTKYQSQFMTDNEDRISRIIKPSGDEIVNLRMGDTYVEKGASVIDDRIPFATLAAQYNLAVTISGDTVDTSAATPSGEPFEVVYILTKSGEEIARATREVNVKGPAIMQAGSTAISIFGDSTYSKSTIEEIILKENIETPDNLVYTIGNIKDASSTSDVYAWIVSGETSGKYKLVIGGDGSLYTSANASYQFHGYSNCTAITNLTCLNTSLATNMNRMFQNNKISNLMFGEKFDTSNVTNMSAMFASCKSLTTLNLGDNFDTSKVTDMSSMFNSCSGLTTLDLKEKFDTSSATDMNYMFGMCNGLTSLNLGDYFDTSSVTNMSYMFIDCSGLLSIDLGEKFDTSNVENMSCMFSGCNNLTSLDLGEKFDTSNVTNMSNMFSGCRGLTDLNIGDNFDTSSVTNMSSMFKECRYLSSIDLEGKFNTRNVTNMSRMFNNCVNLTSIDLGDNFNTSSVTNMSYMFDTCRELTSLDLGDKFDTSKVTDMSSMFSGCESLTILDLGDKFDTSKVTKMGSIFYKCSDLTSIILGEKFDKLNGNSMFLNDASLKAIISLSDTMMTSGDNTLPNTAKAGLYVKTKALEEAYEADSKYQSQFMTDNEDRISRIIKPSGDEIVNLRMGDTYVEKGASVIDDRIPFATLAAQYNLAVTISGDTVDTSVATPSGVPFEVVYILTKSGEEIARATREVHVNGPAIMRAGSNTSYIYGSSYQKEKIDEIILKEDIEIPDNVIYSFGSIKDASSTKEVYAWLISGDTDGMYKLVIGGDGGLYTPLSAKFLFTGYIKCVAITNIECLNTRLSNDMSEMFNNCKKLSSIELGDNFNTNDVIDMSYMFYECRNLSSIDLGEKFDTSSVTNMSNMFDCFNLTSIDLGEKFDTSSVTNMSSMFNGCYYLKSLDLGEKFDTSSVTNMSSMFKGCYNFKSLDLGEKFDTSSVTNMSSMFDGCGGLISLNLGEKFDTSSVTDMSRMFSGCNKLASIDLGEKFDTSSVTNMSSMFKGCYNFKSLDLGEKFDTSSVTNMSSMFDGCGGLISLNLGEKFDTSSVTDMSRMFSGCNKLVSIDLGEKFDTSSVTNMSSLFNVCYRLQSIMLGEKFDRLNGSSMFGGNNVLKAIISLSDTMMTSGDNGLPNTAKAGLYVKTKALEEAYEADTKYQSQFMTDNEDRISRIIKPSGDEVMHLIIGDTYVEKGASVIDDRIPFETLAAQYNLAVTISGDTVNTSAATPSGEPFEVVYILTKSGEEIARATREVYVQKTPVNPPSNVQISTAGYVTWEESDNAEGYEISIDQNTWIDATSGIKFLDDITASSGERTVYVRAYSNDSNYSSPSAVATGSATVYTITFVGSPVAGGSASPASYNVINGATFTSSGDDILVQGIRAGMTSETIKTISPAPNPNYMFREWSETSGTISSDKTITISFTESVDYTVRHYVQNVDSGNYTLKDTENLTAEEGTTLTLSELTKPYAGYTYDAGFLTGDTTKPASGDAVTTTTLTSGGTYVIRLYYTANQYHIYFHEGSGEAVSGDRIIHTMDVSYGQTVTFPSYYGMENAKLFSELPRTELHYWQFYGWSTEQLGTTKKYNDERTIIYSVEGDLNLYALGKKNHNFYSGILAGSPIAVEVQLWNPISTDKSNLTDYLVPSPTQIDGWEFIGYIGGTSVAKGTGIGITPDLIGTMIRSSYTGIANKRSVYKRNIFLAYDANGGSGSIDNSSAVQYYNSGYGISGVPQGDDISTPKFTLSDGSAFTKNGYHVGKWAEGSSSGTQYDASGIYQNFTPAVGSDATTQTMYAIWEPNTYTIAYNYQGGVAGTEAPTTGTYNSSTTISNPTRPGYTFTGWNISGMDTELHTYGSDTTTETTINGTFATTFMNLRASSGTVTFTANWTANSYTVTFDPNSGTVDTVSKTVTYNDIYGELPTPEKTGYSFAGWEGEDIPVTLRKGVGMHPTTGVETTSSISAVSDFIPVDFVNQTYRVTGITRNLYSMAFAYNENHEYMGRIVGSARSSINLTGDSFNRSITDAEGPIRYIKLRQYVSSDQANPPAEGVNAIDGLTIKLEPQAFVTSSHIYRIPGDSTLTAKWAPNDLIFEDKIIRKTYSATAQTADIVEATNGTGSYTYTEVSEQRNGLGTNYMSISGTKINIVAKTPSGTYLYSIRATDNESGITATATYTIVIEGENQENPLTIVGRKLVYSGTGQNLLENPGSTYGTVYYSITQALNSEAGGSVTIPQGTDTGEYRVYFYTSGTDIYAPKSGDVVATIANLTLNSITETIFVGGTTSVKYTYVGDGSITAVSNNSSIATATVSGSNVIITGAGIGTTTITVQNTGNTAYADVSKNITVTVDIDPFYSITRNAETRYYTDLNDAIADAVSGDTIVLLRDKTENESITFWENVKLDLQQYVITTSTPITIANDKTVTITGETVGENVGSVVNSIGTAVINKGKLIIESKDNSDGATLEGKRIGIDSTEGETLFKAGVIAGSNAIPYQGNVKTEIGKYINIVKNENIYEARVAIDTTGPVITMREIEDTEVGSEEQVSLTVVITELESKVKEEEFTADDLTFLVDATEVTPRSVLVKLVSSSGDGHELTYSVIFSGINEDGNLTIKVGANKVFNTAQIGNAETIISSSDISIDSTGPDVEGKIVLEQPSNGTSYDGYYLARINEVTDDSDIGNYQWEIRKTTSSNWTIVKSENSNKGNSFVDGKVTEEGTYEIRVKVSDTHGNSAYSNTVSFVYSILANNATKPTIVFTQESVNSELIKVKALIKSSTNLTKAKVNISDYSELLSEANSTGGASRENEVEFVRVEEGTWQIRTEITYYVASNGNYKFEVTDSNNNTVSAIYIVSDIEREEADIKYYVESATAVERAKIIFSSDQEVILSQLPDGFEIVGNSDTGYSHDIVVNIPSNVLKLNHKFKFTNMLGKDKTIQVVEDVEAANRNVRSIANTPSDMLISNIYGNITLQKANSLVARMKNAKLITTTTAVPYYGIDTSMANITISSSQEISVANSLANATELQVLNNKGNIEDLSSTILVAPSTDEDANNRNKTGIYFRNSSNLIERDSSEEGNTFHVTIINK